MFLPISLIYLFAFAAHCVSSFPSHMATFVSPPSMAPIASPANLVTYAPSPTPHMAHISSPPSPANYMTHALSPAPYMVYEASDEFIEYYGWYRVSSYSDYLSLACYGWFSFLIALDVWFAIRKRATWLPGKAFSLSGVTVQIIAWWTNISSIMNKSRSAHDLASFHQLVVGGRVALCIVIGYLLPGMAAPSVRTFLVLGVSICVQIASETRRAMDDADQNNANCECQTSDSEEFPPVVVRLGNREEIASWILFICIIVLGLISVCAILASKTFHDLLKQRASAVFPSTHRTSFFSSDDLTSVIISPTNEDGRTTISWDDFKDEVLTSWLVARVCRADYVIARSVLSSAVVVVVTFCIIISLLSSTFGNFSIMNPYDALDYAIFCLLFSFIMIGWILLCWRLLSIQSHFRSYRRFLCVEDFWTRSTVELIHIYDLKKDRQQFPKMENVSIRDRLQNFLKNFPTNIFTKLRLHKLLYLVVMLQLGVVCFAKICGILSEVTIGIFVYGLRKCMRKEHPVPLPEKYGMILERVCMPGEDACILWEGNRRAFKEVERLMDQGYMKGTSSEGINLCSKQWEEDIKTLLDTLQREAFPSILKHFPSLEKQSVRITAVSLIRIFLRVHKAKSESLDKLLRACHEVWDLLSFADECDIDLEANEICLSTDLEKDRDQVSIAAERELYRLQMEHDKRDPGSKEPVVDVQVARGILRELLDECVDFLRNANLLGGEDEAVAKNLSDSKDWMEIVPKYYLYKLCKLMLEENEIEKMLQDYEIPDFGTLINKVVQNIIAFSLSRLPDMLVKQCWKWAQEFEEDKLWEAIQRAGKCRGMMERCESKPKLTRNPTKLQKIQGLQTVRGMQSV